jgi:hypothetical protein
MAEENRFGKPKSNTAHRVKRELAQVAQTRRK